MLDKKPSGRCRQTATDVESAMAQALEEGNIEIFY